MPCIAREDSGNFNWCQWGTVIQNAYERHSCAHKETSVRKKMHQILISEFGEKKSEKFPSLNVIQTGSKNGRSPNAPPYDQKSAEDNEEQQEFARCRACKLHKGASSRRNDTKDVSSDETIQNQKDNDQFLQYFPKKNCTQLTVALRYICGIIFCWIAKRRRQSAVKQHSGYSDRQWHRGLRHASKGLHQGAWRWLTDAFGERFSVSGIIGKSAMNLVFSSSWPTEETPRLSKGEKVIKCNIDTFVTMDADTTQKAVPSIEFSTAKGNLEREQEVEDTMLDLLQPCTQGSQERDASSQIPTLRFPNSDRSVPIQKETTMCPLVIRKTPIVRFVRRHKQPEARCRMTPRKRVDLIGFFFKIRRLDHGRSQFWTWKSSRDADTQRSHRARRFHEWDSEWSDEDKRDIGNNVVFTKIFCPSQMLITIYTNNYKELIKVCQVLQWNHDTSTPHRSGTNWVAERAVCRVKEGNSSRSRAKRDHQKNGGTVRWDAHVICAPCRTIWQMTRQHSRRYMDRSFTDHQFFLEFWLRLSHFTRKTNQEYIILERNRWMVIFLGYVCSTCGRRLVGTLDDSSLWIFARIRSLRNLGQKIQKPRCIRGGENEFPSDRHWRQRYKIFWRIQVGEMENLPKSRILPDLTVSGLELV